MNLLSSTSVFGFYTLISRVLGYLRDILIAIFLGTTIYADAFFVAFRLPNTFRRLFAEGTFNAAFIPSYAKAQKNAKEGKRFADEVFNLLLYILIFIIIIVEIFTPAVVYLIAPGFYGDSEKLNLAVELSEQGVLDKYKIKLIGSTVETIKNAEDRELFRKLLSDLGEPVPPSEIVDSLESAIKAKEIIGLPMVISCLLYTSPSPRDQRGSGMPACA